MKLGFALPCSQFTYNYWYIIEWFRIEIYALLHGEHSVHNNNIVQMKDTCGRYAPATRRGSHQMVSLILLANKLGNLCA